MSALCLLRVLALVSHVTLLIAADSNLICQNFKFDVDEDVVYNHILEGHVFKRLTVYSAVQCHVICKGDCLCVSINYFPLTKENNCELNDVNKEMEPGALKWKQGVNYYNLVRSYTVKGGGNFISGIHRCVNRCCRDNPCVNGGVCQETCYPNSTRFNCICPDTHTGRRCETIKHPRTCKDIAKNGISTPGKYLILSGYENEAFSVFCDMTSESGFVWALIQSFSLANKNLLKDKMFGIDFPVNHAKNKVDWNSYRLSLTQMESLANHSTHLRVTCNFPTEGLQYTDYVRAKLEGHDIFDRWSNRCQLYEYLNIRGIECFNCTAWTKQTNLRAWRVKSYLSASRGCDFDGRPGGIEPEANFGYYGDGTVNADHRCTSSSASTTQHWFGAKHEW